MINSANSNTISNLLNTDSKVVYKIPRYQRRYTWSKKQWERLVDDIIDNEEGYFLGTIICISSVVDQTASELPLHLVDGQQRMTTIALLIAAIYGQLKPLDIENQLNDEQKNTIFNLRSRLLLGGGNDKLRLTPQHEGDNFEDYRYVLYLSGVINDVEPPRYAGNRLITKCFRYFEQRVKEMIEEADSVGVVFEKLIPRINTAIIVKIEVGSNVDAATLFESLNNTGVPLSVVDLIKNSLLAKLEDRDEEAIDEYYKRWMSLIRDLGDDNIVQERFFRNYYNAFRWRWGSTDLARRSNIIELYQKRIDDDPESLLENLRISGRYNQRLLGGSGDEDSKSYDRELRGILNIQGVPSHSLLLFLLVEQEKLGLSDAQIGNIAKTLIGFFVRRNLTDKPPTRDLIRLFTDLIEEIRTIEHKPNIHNHIRQRLADLSASDERFKEALSGAIYDENAGVTRFVLCALAEENMTDETFRDLWARKSNNNKGYYWTIEHVFPQGETIPEEWVKMIANGDVEEANRIRSEHVHQLGNLTLTGFNTNLSNRPFVEKRDYRSEGKLIGYKNGLAINAEIAAADTWTLDQIKERTQSMVDKILEIFPLEQP
jgi:hypothetical protein